MLRRRAPALGALRPSAYYDANRASRSLLYTDHAIYSPGVPFFRSEQLSLLEHPFLGAVLTMPAPNAGEHLAREPSDREGVHAALERRVAMVLAVARAHHHAVLVLGAWGCGVFRNDPLEVATLFDAALASEPFSGAFERVVFAVYDRQAGANRAAFDAVFAGRRAT
jgi:uncharacterized protein (TIGR02452 family)